MVLALVILGGSSLMASDTEVEPAVLEQDSMTLETALLCEDPSNSTSAAGQVIPLSGREACAYCLEGCIEELNDCKAQCGGSASCEQVCQQYASQCINQCNFYFC